MKQVEGKEKVSKKEAREQEIAIALKAHNEKEHLVGKNLPETQQVFRVKVVSAFLRAAVPLSKLHFFKELLEEGGIVSLTGAPYLILFHSSEKRIKMF